MNIFCSALALIFLLSFAKEVYSYPSGAPTSVCSSLIPTGHSGTNQATDSPGGFFIYSDLGLFDAGNAGAFEPSTTYSIYLSSPNNRQFRGFLIQARDSNGDPIGSFTVLDGSNSQTLTCFSDSDSAVTHTNNDPKSMISFQWISPGLAGTVVIRYTVVTARLEDYYANLNAADNRPPPSVPTALGYHSFSFGIPEDCTGSNCSYYVGLNVNEENPNYLDIYLEGDAASWIAIGFSLDQYMGTDDVLGCRGTDTSVLDTWNPNGRNANVADDDDVNANVYSFSFENDRIVCSFNRLIEGGDTGRDYNLNNAFWLLYARRDSTGPDSANSFSMHSLTPSISESMYNPVTEAEVTTPPDTTEPTDMVNTDSPDMDNADQCSFNYSSSGDYDFTYGSPGGDYYVATRINPYNTEYLDFVLEGVADGWVAIGFSQDREMWNDDVLGCRVSNDAVIAVDTWNTAPRRSPNEMDYNQTDICMHSGSFVDGRITCRFSRLIIGDNSDQDYDLSGEYYLFFGRRAASQESDTTFFNYHSFGAGATPSISANLTAVITPAVGCPRGPTSDVEYTFEYGESEDDYFLQTRVNPYNSSYLDIHLEGNADGWVALGLSTNRIMEEDDVIGCRTDNGQVTVMDAWNPIRRYAANVVDDSQDDICTHFTMVSDGRISCTFSRLIAGTSSTEDYNFNRTYYLFYGLRSSAQPSANTNFAYHSANGGDTPSISVNQTNIVTGATGAGAMLTPSTMMITIQFLLIMGASIRMML